MLLLALIVLPLAACGPSDKGAVSSQLPPVPADIQTCFRAASGGPDKALNAGEIEAMWKNDRVKVAVNARCGARVLAWYESLRVNWK